MGRIVTLVSSAARTSTGNTDVTLPAFRSGTLHLDVTAASGTGETLDIGYRYSYDGGTTYLLSVLRHAQMTAAGEHAIRIHPSMTTDQAGSAFTPADTGGALNVNTVLPADINVIWTIGGTNPSFTFSIFLICSQEEF